MQALAEKAAWEFMEKEKPGFDLATIRAPLVYGPVAHHLESLSGINTSNQKIRDFVQGKHTGDQLPPTVTFLWVDVRDLALAHVRALEVSAAGGHCFFTAAGPLLSYTDSRRDSREPSRIIVSTSKGSY
jgi:nucleoside-diphosphate-sugar epimerase